MKYVRYSQNFVGADGFPFSITNPDRRVQRQARDTAIEEGKAQGLTRQQVTFDLPAIDEPSFAQVIEHLLNDGRCWHRDAQRVEEHPLGAEGLGHSYQALKAFKAPVQDVAGQLWIELEDPVYQWLVEWNQIEGPSAMGMTQAVIAERLADVHQDQGPQKATPESKETASPNEKPKAGWPADAVTAP